MTQLTIRLEGDDRVRVGLNRWANTLEPLSREKLLFYMERAKKRSIPWLGGSRYAVPERGYRRTGNLGASADVVLEGLSARIQVEAYRNGRRYDVFVVGDAGGQGQAVVHQGWWVPLRKSVDDEVSYLADDLDESIQSSAEAAGL